MRWPAFAILVYLTLGLQVGVSRYVQFRGAAPNFALIAVVFISLNARRNQALLGSFLIGLLQDMLGGGPPGLFAFSYGLVAMFVHSTHNLVSRNNPLAHLALTLIGGFMVFFLILLQSWLHPAGAPIPDGKATLGAIRIPVRAEFYRVLYTALVAPVMLYALGRVRTVFGFQPGRRSGR